MSFSKPSAPVYTPPPKVAQAPDEAVVKSIDDERKRRAAANGLASTLLTGPAGVPSAPLKTLLGA